MYRTRVALPVVSWRALLLWSLCSPCLLRRGVGSGFASVQKSMYLSARAFAHMSFHTDARSSRTASQ